MATFPDTTGADGIWTLKKVRRGVLATEWPTDIIDPPTAPSTVTAVAGDTQATVTYSGESAEGTATFTVTSSPEGITAVSYTHLTLPTNREV